ncbi:MAG: hypothetical protein WCT03_11255 [Candidatus Obscuribacterales bacterium]|jgi:hypothetical protein
MLKKVKNEYVLTHSYYGLLQIDEDSALWPTGDNLSQVAPTSSWEIFKDIDRVKDSIAAK